MLIFWSLVRNSVVLAVYLLFSVACFLTVHEHYFKDYKNEKFNLDAIEKQQRIVDILKKIENIIESRQQELQKLDDLIRARFVEMFGNPLDKSKANMYFVECVEFNPKKSEVKDLMCETVSFVPMECVGADGSFKIKEDGLVKDYYKGYTYFKNGDVLLAKITPCFENGKVAIAENCTNGIGFGTTEFHVSRPIPGVSNSQWIKYMLKNEHVHELATINMTGSAGQKRIQTPFFEKLKVYLPPIELQNQFADFVSQIDKSKLLSGCRLFHSWAPENRDKPKHVGVPRRETKDLRGGRRQQ
ncbi:restriction endonuclease subunit S [Anaerovoracaceae bacterium SGI.174]